jgi:hypothetical protein
MKCERCGKEMKQFNTYTYGCMDLNCKPPKRTVKVPKFKTQEELEYYQKHYRY